MSKLPSTLIGIDYGSKLAGTTVIAQASEEMEVFFTTSEKKKDADAFLLQTLRPLPPSLIFIDAPLSLPGKYRYPDRYNDFFYRQADRQLKAMSPMFLGGLTARAMRLQENLNAQGHRLCEAYPAALARLWQLKDLHYKKQKEHIPAVLDFLQQQSPLRLSQAPPTTWHHVDAFLALLTAYRHAQQSHQTYGNPEEGLIVV